VVWCSALVREIFLRADLANFTVVVSLTLDRSSSSGRDPSSFTLRNCVEHFVGLQMTHLQHLLFFDIKGHRSTRQSMHLVLDFRVDSTPTWELLLTNHALKCSGGHLFVVIVKALIVVESRRYCLG